jgi:8-oxo-dGTP diphosphatase
MKKNPDIDHCIRTGAYALIIQNGQIFLTRKAKGPHQQLWDLPGGGISFSETPLEALHRELLEEASLLTTDPTLLTVLSHHGTHHSQRYHHLGIIYRLHNITPTTHTPEEEGRWFPVSALTPTQLTPFVRQLLTQGFLI